MKKKTYRSFEDARKFVQELKLKSIKEWVQYCQSGEKPEDIPTIPERSYKNKGWKGYGDWLGTGAIAAMNRKFRSYEEARKFVQELGIKTTEEWKQYCKSGEKPVDVPALPSRTYKKEWRGWNDFVGTKQFFLRDAPSYEEFKKWVQDQGIKSETEWRNLEKSKLPPNYPKYPLGYYKRQGKWISWGHFFGTRRLAFRYRKFRTFEEARKFVRESKVKSQHEWNQFCKSGKKPEDIPAGPPRVYKKEWKGWGDWFGTGYVANFQRNYRSFEEARKFARKTGFKTQMEWRKYDSSKFPKDIPQNPYQHYKKEWKGWGDFLGTRRVANQDREFRSFQQARKFVHALKLKSQHEWNVYRNSGEGPKDIPQNPPQAYKKEWTTWGDWLGTGRVANQERSKNYLSANDARIAIKKIAKEVFGGKPFTEQDWIKAHQDGKIPENLPRRLSGVYNPEERGKRKEKQKKRKRKEK